MAPALIADNDITVTSATQTPEALASHFGEKVETSHEGTTTEKIEAPGVTDGESSARAAAPSAERVLEEEATSDKPDSELSEAGRRLRSNRFDSRVSRLRDDIELYEDNLKLLGAQVPAFEKRQYQTKQAEIDALSRRRSELLRATNAALKAPAEPRPAAVPAGDTKPVAAEPRREAVAPEFKFPTWEEWQEQTGHEDKSHSDYIDARTDARYAFNERRTADRVQQERAAASVRDRAVAFKGHEDAFRKETPDYDDAIAAVAISEEQLASPQWRDLKSLVAQSGAAGPRVMYHLAKNPEDLAALLGARNRIELTQEFGGVKRAAVKGTATAVTPGEEGKKPAAEAKAAAASPPSKPTSSAPAPVTPVSGSAASGRSLASIAAEDDDADAYIESRGKGHLLKH